MSRFEHAGLEREKWPLSMDLEGVPRDNKLRKELLLGRQDMVNKFAGEMVLDINNPPKEPYNHQDFPKLVYHHGNGGMKFVKDSEGLTAAEQEGWKTKPSPKYDYSRARNGKAPKHMTEEEAEIALNGKGGRFLEQLAQAKAPTE